MTAAIAKNQWEDKPVHEWAIPDSKGSDLNPYRYSPAKLRVEEFMQTDLFTAQKDDIVDLVAELMDWRVIRFMPVEDAKGKLVGLISSRTLLRHFASSYRHKDEREVTVEEIMIKNPKTVYPETKLMDALAIMRTNKIGCLPVINQDEELIGVITEMDFLRISTRLMEGLEKQDKE